MTLTLKIENYDVLEDGGPAQITVQGHGFSAGRSSAMDWVLPDPSRHISSRHFEVSFQNGAYYLTDVSTNGIFLKGQPYRLDGPHLIRDQDRFQAGHYIIVAHVARAGLSAGAPLGAPSQAGFAPPPGYGGAQQAPPAPAVDDNDPWSLGPVSNAPIDVNPRGPARAYEDFADDFIVNPEPAAPPPPPPRPPAPPRPPVAGGAVPLPGAAQGGFDPALGAGAPPAPAPAPGGGAASGAAIARAFCEGAGLPPEAAAGVDGEALARELGRAMRIATQEMMALLQDRASAKKFTKSGDRTMMGAQANNPLKFLPGPEQALEAMFLKPKDGFMQGSDGLAEALSDVRRHQGAVFAAIQPALAKLLADLSPEAIEESAGSGLLGAGRKGKAWETFVDRWDAKVEAHENGMLDVFLVHFAEAYAAAVAGGKK